MSAIQKSLTPKLNERIVIRNAEPDDIPFVYSVWLRCYRHDSMATRYIGNDDFYQGHQCLLNRLLSQPLTKVLIACDSQDNSLLFGFMAYEPNVIHFIYVKKPFRRMGIMTAFLENQGLDLMKCKTTHVTTSLIEMWNANYTTIKYNPYLMQAKL